MTATSLAELTATQALHRPDAPAVVDIDRTWTWAEIDDEIARTAGALAEAGVRRGDRVGVHHHKCAVGFAAMHAAVRIGAVAVPLDPGSPAKRLAGICSALDVSVIATHTRRTTSMREIAAEHPLEAVLGLDGDVGAARTIGPAEIAATEPVDPVQVDVDAPAYILTTSGSTGEPKGIVHTHRSAMAYIDISIGAFELTASDRVADIAPHHFDISTFALWSTPRVGATNVIVPEPHQRMPASLSQLVADQRVTMWYSVPFLMQQLVERGDIDNRDLSAIRVVQLGGELISPEMLAVLFDAMPGASIANVYGPAEVNTCSVHVLPCAPDPGAHIPIGRPTDGCTFRLVAPGSDRPAPEVEPEGELWVASPAMMSSYADRTEADSSIVTDDGNRWYRTGDLVSIDAEGFYVFHGRVDNQVKVRGYRIELEWVEASLEGIPGVSSAVADVLRRDDGTDVIVAGVVDPVDHVDTDAVRISAMALLPPYAAPAQVVVLSGSEVTGSGKLNRRTLRQRLLAEVRESAPSKGQTHERRND